MKTQLPNPQSRNQPMVLQYRFRLYLIAVLLMGGFSGLLFRLWDVQITDHQLYAERVPGTSTVLVRVPGVRGEIQDRHGTPLVTNRFEYEIALNLRDIEDHYKRFAGGEIPKVERIFHHSGFPQKREVADIAAIVDETVIRPMAQMGLVIELTAGNRKEIGDLMWGTDGYVPYSLYSGLTHQQFAMLAERSHEIPGLQLKAHPMRHYRYGSLAGHYLGYVRRADELRDRGRLQQEAQLPGKAGTDARAEWEQWFSGRNRYYVADPFGALGIEAAMDSKLRGRAGLREFLKNQKGIYVRQTRNVPAKPGFDVRLTLDLRAQYIVEMALRKAGIGRGAAVLIDPNNGDILAMAAVPSYNPNRFIPTIAPEDYNRYLQDPALPLINRATAAYPPGSTFKIPVALAGGLGAIQDASFTCSGVVSFGNKPLHCMGRHGGIGLRRAIMKSCNCFFYNYGVRAGIDHINRVTDMFGLGKPAGLPIDEQPGLVPNPHWLQETRSQKWSSVMTAMSAIGQAGVATSPLQMANVAAIVANGGKSYRLRLIYQVNEHDGSTVEAPTPELLYDLREHGISAEVIETVRSGMLDVVNEIGGTARRAALEDIVVAGKTGTAQYMLGPGKEDTHAWFICFAPFEEPRYALSVFVESGKSGGRVASPIAKKILQELFGAPERIHFPPLAEAQSNFDFHEETVFEGEFWSVPSGESDTADTAVAVDNPDLLTPSGSQGEQDSIEKPSLREKVNLVPAPVKKPR